MCSFVLFCFLHSGCGNPISFVLRLLHRYLWRMGGLGPAFIHSRARALPTTGLGAALIHLSLSFSHSHTLSFLFGIFLWWLAPCTYVQLPGSVAVGALPQTLICLLSVSLFSAFLSNVFKVFFCIYQ